MTSAEGRTEAAGDELSAPHDAVDTAGSVSGVETGVDDTARQSVVVTEDAEAQAPSDGFDDTTSAFDVEPSRVVAEGRLHPGFLFLRAFDGIRQSILPLAFSLFTGQPFFAVVALVVFVVSLIQSLARFATFRWRLTDDELATEEGILRRQERRIPVNRIQDLNFESSLLRRVFGLVVVSVETASSQGAEAQLDSLARADAERLREALYAVRTERGLAQHGATDREQEDLLYATTPLELIVRGLTTNRLGALLVAAFGLYSLSIEFGFDEVLVGAFGGLAGTLSAAAAPLIAVLAVAVGFLAILAGWLISIAASFLLFHGFELSLGGDVFLRRYGLITSRASTLPRRKIQRVLLEQSALRRLLGFTVVRADTAGSGVDEAASRSGSDVVAPLTRDEIAVMLVPWLLPGVDVQAFRWNRVSPRVVMRTFMKSLLSSLALTAILWSLVGSLALITLCVIPPIGFGAGLLAWRNMGWAHHGGHVAFRHGILGRRRAIVPLRKVQAAVLRAGPLERRLGLANLTVYVAGGSPTRLTNLPEDEARALELAIARGSGGQPLRLVSDPSRPVAESACQPAPMPHIRSVSGGSCGPVLELAAIPPGSRSKTRLLSRAGALLSLGRGGRTLPGFSIALPTLQVPPLWCGTPIAQTRLHR